MELLCNCKFPVYKRGERKKKELNFREEGEISSKSREEGEIGSESREKGDLPPCSTPLTSSETQGQLVGTGKSLNQAKKTFGRRKVKNAKKSPWGQGFKGPVPNGQASSGF